MSELQDRQNDAVRGSLKLLEQRYATRNPRSASQHRAAQDLMPGGNTRTTLFFPPFPLVFASGSGQRLTDVDGHIYTDFLGEYSAGLYGHSHPVILSAVRQALENGLALGGPNEYEVQLASQIRARYPSVDLLRFTNSGTEANLMAIAAARAVTGRTHTLVFEAGYHGGVLSFRGEAPLNAPFPTLIADFNDLATATTLIEENSDRLASVIVEPLLGGAGVIPGSAEFLVGLREVTSRCGVLLIFDEVMTSRLAPGGLQQVYHITPDLTTFGKYMGGGFNFGAFGGSSELMKHFDPTREGSFAHAGTFNNNVVTMAAGAAGLRSVFTPEVAVMHNARGDSLRAAMNKLFRSREVEMSATGLGSLIGIHFQTTPIHRAADIVAADQKRALLHLEMLTRGFYFARRGYIAMALPLTDGDIEAFLGALDDVIEAHLDHLRSPAAALSGSRS